MSMGPPLVTVKIKTGPAELESNGSLGVFWAIVQKPFDTAFWGDFFKQFSN